MPTNRKRRLGVMGGTFDPIHFGHLVCAEEARWQLDLDEVVWVPTGKPWQKASDVSSPEDRYMMTVLGTAANEHFSVSRLEIDRGGPTYTFDTLRELRGFFGDRADLYFISGADAILQILTWKEPEAVLSEANFIAATRPDFDITEHQLKQFHGRVSLMQIPALAISSTDIRRRVAEGRPIRYLLPFEVARYIEERGLYRSSGAREGDVAGERVS